MTKTKLETFTYETIENTFTSAIVVAAGGSTRMGKPKMFLPLAGISVIGRTLMAVNSAKNVDEIIVVAKEEKICDIQKICDTLNIHKLACITVGGDTRTQSVKNGLAKISDRADFVLMHDGARPLIEPTLIDNAIKTAYIKDAVSLGVPLKDTVKQVDSEGKVISTPDREALMLVQTPQVFNKAKFVHATTQFSHCNFTDDCAFMEEAGIPVYIIKGDYKNIKITTPEDIETAEGFIKGDL